METEGLTRFYVFCLELVVGKRNTKPLLVSRLQDGHDLLHPVAPLPIQEDGDICKIGVRALSMFSRRNEEGPRACHRRRRRYPLSRAQRESNLTAWPSRPRPCAADPPSPVFLRLLTTRSWKKSFLCATLDEQFPSSQTPVEPWQLSTACLECCHGGAALQTCTGRCCKL